MEKAQVLNEIALRIKNLKAKYIDACSDICNGKTRSKNGAAVTRSRLKRDICIAMFVYEVVAQCRETFQLSDDALLGFEKLIMLKE